MSNAERDPRYHIHVERIHEAIVDADTGDRYLAAGDFATFELPVGWTSAQACDHLEAAGFRRIDNLQEDDGAPRYP